MLDELISAVLEGMPDAEINVCLFHDEYRVRVVLRKGDQKHCADRLLAKAEMLTTHDPAYVGHYIGRVIVEEFAARGLAEKLK